MIFQPRARMRRLTPVLFVFALTVACAAPRPPATPAPTPTSLRPAILLTPRPTLPPPTATPFTVTLATPRAAPTATPTPSPQGTPVTASEPLQGLLLDDHLLSPIIGEGFPYRIYL